MIDSIRGRLTEKHPTKLLIDVGGMGFEVNVPLTCFEKVGPVGTTVSLPTYLYLREDGVKLYGFSSKEERDLFLELISVSKIGPRVAQGVLSGISVSEFKRAIIGQNVDRLTVIPGVGPKTARRMVMELREKLTEAEPELIRLTGEISPNAAEAVGALVSLGFKKVQAEGAVARVLKVERKDIPLENLVKKALQSLYKG